MIKECVVCGEDFEARNRRHVVCGKECRMIRNREFSKKTHKNHKEIKTCIVCGEKFETNIRRQIFCSEECRTIQNIHKERSGMIITPGTKVLFNKTRLEIEYRKDMRFNSNDEFMKYLLDNVGYSLR